MASKDPLLPSSRSLNSSSDMEQYSYHEIHSHMPSKTSITVGKGRASAGPQENNENDPDNPVNQQQDLQPQQAQQQHGAEPVPPPIANYGAVVPPQGPPPVVPPPLKIHKLYCIPEQAGKHCCGTCIAAVLLCSVSIVFLALLLAVVGSEVILQKTQHDMPKAAFQVVSLNRFLPYSNLLSKEICIHDIEPTSDITIMLAKMKCSDVSIRESNVSITSSTQAEDEYNQGLLFYWLEDTLFELEIYLDDLEINDDLKVLLLNTSTEYNSNLLGMCVDPDIKNVVCEWILPNESDTQCADQKSSSSDSGPYIVSARVTKSDYYYLCFQGKMDNFSIDMNLHHYDYNHDMETCTTVGEEPCCISYSNIFTELHDGTCTYLVSNLTDIPPGYLENNVPKINVSAKIGVRWWVFAVLLFLTLAAMLTTGMLCTVCFFSNKRDKYRNACTCRRIFTCSCYQYEVIEHH